MKLRKLHIEDYKMFKDFDISFVDEKDEPLPIVVLAGVNGSGKTSLLEFLKAVEAPKNISIYGQYNPFGSFNIQFIDNNEEYEVSSIEAPLNEYCFLNEEIIYLSSGIDEIQNISNEFVKTFYFFLKNHDYRPSEVMTHFYKYMKDIFDGLDLTFTYNHLDRDDNVWFINKNGKAFEIKDLSTGEKTLLSKIMYLYFKDYKNKIILIDEPELSLHPSWQNKVLKIYENFAKQNDCQIIIATHSPHIIGSAKNEYIRLLTEDGVIDNFSKSYGLEFSKVLTDIMGVDNLRTPDVEKDFRFIKKEIYSNNYRDNPRFEKVWKHLEENLESNDIDLDVLRHDFELIKKMIFSYENIDKEEFREAWDRLEENLGKSDLDLKLLRLEMKFRDK